MASGQGLTFTCWGETYTYERGRYNNAARNERAVEVPIARRWVGRQRGDGIEVGNVLGHYGRVAHTVLDRYEVAEGVNNVDLFAWHEPADWIVAISTIEHVRWDEPGEPRRPGAAELAVRHLYGLLRPGGRMLVSVPLGWHPRLEAALPGLPTSRACTMVQDADGGWTQFDGVEHRPYGAQTIWAGAVWIGEMEADHGQV